MCWSKAMVYRCYSMTELKKKKLVIRVLNKQVAYLDYVFFKFGISLSVASLYFISQTRTVIYLMQQLSHVYMIILKYFSLCYGQAF